MDTKNNSKPLIPADAPDDYIIGYEIEGKPIILKNFLEQAEKSLDKHERGYYYKHEELFEKYDAYLKYLKDNPDVKLTSKDFDKKFPEHSPTFYHGPNEFELVEVKHYLDSSIADAFQHVNVFKVIGDNISLGRLFATDLLDGRYSLGSKEEIMKAMDEKGKGKEDAWPRMSFKWEHIAENKFTSITKDSLEKTLRTYAKQPDWGIDLPFFLESIERTIEIMAEASETSTILYVNKDEAPKSDQIEYDWHGYAFIIIILDSTNEKLTTINLGGE